MHVCVFNARNLTNINGSCNMTRQIASARFTACFPASFGKKFTDLLIHPRLAK